MDELHKIVEIQWNLKEWGKIKSNSKEYVSVCYNLRPLAILSQLLGLFPVKHLFADKASDLRHRTFSLLNAYGYVSYAFLIYLHTTNFIYALNFLRYLSILSDVIFLADIVAFSLSWNKYILLLRKCDDFDRRFRNLPVKIYLRRSKYRRYVFLMPTVCISAVLFSRNINIYFKYFSIDSRNLIFMVTEALIFVPRVVQTSLYAFTCDELTFRFSQLHRSWVSYLKYLSDTRANIAGVDLDKYRLLNLHLLSCIRLADKFFGFRLAVIFLNTFTDTVYYVLCFYFFHVESFDLFLTIYFTIIGSVLVTAWIIIWSTSELISKSQKIKKYVFRILTLDMPLVLRIEIDHLLQELQIHKEEITAWGLFSLNRKLIGAFIMHAITYFIALSQLSSIVSDIDGKQLRSLHKMWVNGTAAASLNESSNHELDAV